MKLPISSLDELKELATREGAEIALVPDVLHVREFEHAAKLQRIYSSLALNVAEIPEGIVHQHISGAEGEGLDDDPYQHSVYYVVRP